MPVGRPTEYKEDILAKANEYIDSCIDKEEEYHKTRGEKSNGYERLVKVNIPTIEGLAVFLGIHRSTVYDWKETYAEFSDILERLQAVQTERLINNGLSGNYNALITKLLLYKQGYRETDRDEDSKRIEGNVIRFVDYSTEI